LNRIEPAELAHDKRRQADAECRRHGGEHQTLRQQLADQTALAGSNRCADREFALQAESASEQKIGHHPSNQQ
jgi:hypothetical protein